MKRRIPTPEPEQLEKLNLSHYFLFFLLFVCIFACYKLLRPYLNTLIVATILSTILRPVNQKIEQWVHGRKNLAAFLSCTLLTLVVVLPLAFMMFAIIQQGIQTVTAIYNWIAAGKYNALLEGPWARKIVALGDKYLPDIQKFFPDFNLSSIRLDQIVLRVSSSLGKILIDQGGSLFGNITSLIGNFLLMIFALFFMTRDQEKFFKTILHLIPLSASHERKIIDKVTEVTRSALLGTIVTAIAQGTAGGIAFSIANLPGLFWGAAMAFASLIPLVGTAVIWLPAAGYLILSGHWGYGIFVFCWCALIAGMIDNVVRPLFMQGSGKNMSMLLIFLSLLGGLNYFGLIGLLYGPLIIGLTLVLLYIYSLEFKSFLTYQDKH
jgi:predicted PurR-regulated permease PerM